MQVNDYVIHKMDGICKIADVIFPDFAQDKDRPYYVLIPEANKSAKSYVPVDIVEERCRELITEDEAIELIEGIDDIEMAEISNEKEREHIYRSAIKEGDLKKIVAILKNINHRQQKRQQIGKKSTSIDEKYFEIADRSLCREIGFVLNLSDSEVRQRLMHRD